MQLEKNMYVRTDKGRIGKVLTERYEYKDDYNQEIQFKNGVEDTWDMDWEDISKASHNIIDLIEVGDYVNGFPVSDIYIDEYIADNDKLKFGDKDLVLSFKSNMDTYYLYTDSIKSIVTKEQFEQMQYKVGE